VNGTDADLPQRIRAQTRPRPELLTGPRVTLRPLTERDIAPLVEILSHPDLAPWWPIQSEASVREDLFGDEGGLSLAVERQGVLIGVVMYSEQLWRDYFSAGIDIALASDQRGEGIGPEVLRTLIRWLIDVGGHHRITIDPAASNTRAIRAYEKVGFRPVGTMRQYERGPDGRWRDGLLMDLLAEEFVDEQAQRGA